MIDLITGLPGNAKTAFTIASVRDLAKADNRDVYYSGIPLTDKGREALGWHEIEAEKWMTAPPNSIVIIDECQRIFRNRSINTVPPKHVSDLETHRHLGIDLVFITQHPMLIDPAIRRLTGRHRHMVRIMGLEKSTVHEWTAVRDNCDKSSARKDSDKKIWAFDKTVYPLYKSAELHTVKRNIPRRLKLLLCAPLVIGAGLWYVAHFINGKVHPTTQQAQPGQSADILGTGIGTAQAKRAQEKEIDPIADAKRYTFDNTPRITNVAFTAPKYDKLTEPTAVPVPAACLFRQGICLCYTQQATRMNMPHQACVDIVNNGYFEEFDRDGRKQDDKRRESVAALDRGSSLPLSGVSTADYRPSFELPHASERLGGGQVQSALK